LDPISDAHPVREGDDLVARVHSLSGEVAGLRRAMRTRGIIEQAKGMLAQRLGCTPEEAFSYLSRLSQEHNMRLSELAGRLVERTMSVLGSPRTPADPQPTPPPQSSALKLFAVGQNVTGQRPADPDRLLAERQLAAHRMSLASDLRRLDRVAGAPAELDTARPGLRIVARRLAPGHPAPRSGAFYQAVPLPDGSTVLAVGDGYGSGVEVASAMARLSAELRGLALAGVPPGRLLTLLNADLLRQSAEPGLASVLVASYEPATRTITWAQAGHPAPLLIREGGAGIPPRPPGVLLGLLPDSEYPAARLRLDPGDAIVLFTDAIVHSRRTGDGNLARHLLDLTGQAASQGGLAHVVAALNPADPREACVLAAQVAITPPEQDRAPPPDHPPPSG
jgi:hypothetical protein